MKKIWIAVASIITTVTLLISSVSAGAEEAWLCMICGESNTGNFCEVCGNAKGSWVCDECHTINTRNFCKNCGSAREDSLTDLPMDGAENLGDEGEIEIAGQQMVSQQSGDEELRDAMLATIDGTEYRFDLKNVKVGNTLITASYETYNPRGELLYSVLIFLNKDITPGVYNSESSADFSVSCSLMKAVGRDLNRNSLMDPQGSFTFELTYRSDDWMTYSGTFDAHLVKKATMFATSNSMEMTNAAFNFTIPAASSR